MKNSLKEMFNDAGYKVKFIFLFILIIVTLLIELCTIPYITKQIIDVEIPNGNIRGLFVYVSVYIIVFFTQCYMVLKHCDMRSILRIMIERDLKGKVFNKLQDVNLKFYDENTTGTILQFLQNDVNNASILFPRIITEMYVMGLIRFGITTVFLMFIDIKITLYIILLYIIGFLITLVFNKKTVRNINQVRKINMELYTYINEAVQGFLTIKTLNIIEEKEKELSKKLEEYTVANKKIEKIVAGYNSIFSFITAIGTAVITYFGGANIVQGIASYAEIMLLIDYASSLRYDFNWFIKHLTNFNKSFIAYSKILEFIKTDNIERIEEGEKLENIDNIEFKNIYFSYNNNQKTIKDFSLKISKGESCALIGKTGSGKSTIINLLCRFYETNKGKILVNGEDYKKYCISSLRNRIGYIMQDVQILPNSIIDNIRYVNKDIKISEIKDIFRRLKLHDKIMSLKNQYYTNIYDNMDILSTGERQLINFARIMAINPDVVVLDEVTSNLSIESEMLVGNAINEVIKGKIAIIIAHRLSTIEKCSKIVELSDGKIVKA